jgi:hypothetical protein
MKVFSLKKFVAACKDDADILKNLEWAKKCIGLTKKEMKSLNDNGYWTDDAWMVEK